MEIGELKEVLCRHVDEKSLFGVYVIHGCSLKYINHRFAEIFSYERQELQEMGDLYPLLHEEDRDGVVEKFAGRSPDDRFRCRFRGRKKDGGIIYVDSVNSVMEYQGEPFIVGSVIDITELMETEDALRESMEVLKRSEEERSSFLPHDDPRYQGAALGNIGLRRDTDAEGGR
ncbi:MAG: PAS domain S-box protein [Nitrospirota bacterium]